MSFPTLVYKCPGNHQCQGGTYNYKPVADQDELDALLADGWNKSLPDAMAPKQEIKPVIPADDAPPTRAELVAKAEELGIVFDKRIGDKKLGQLIKDKLNV